MTRNIKGPKIKDMRLDTSAPWPENWFHDPFHKFPWQAPRYAITNTSVYLYGQDVAELVHRLFLSFRKEYRRKPKMIVIWNFGVEAI